MTAADLPVSLLVRFKIAVSIPETASMAAESLGKAAWLILRQNRLHGCGLQLPSGVPACPFTSAILTRHTEDSRCLKDASSHHGTVWWRDRLLLTTMF